MYLFITGYHQNSRSFDKGQSRLKGQSKQANYSKKKGQNKKGRGRARASKEIG